MRTPHIYDSAASVPRRRRDAVRVRVCTRCHVAHSATRTFSQSPICCAEEHSSSQTGEGEVGHTAHITQERTALLIRPFGIQCEPSSFLQMEPTATSIGSPCIPSQAGASLSALHPLSAPKLSDRSATAARAPAGDRLGAPSASRRQPWTAGDHDGLCSLPTWSASGSCSSTSARTRRGRPCSRSTRPRVWHRQPRVAAAARPTST